MERHARIWGGIWRRLIRLARISLGRGRLPHHHCKFGPEPAPRQRGEARGDEREMGEDPVDEEEQQQQQVERDAQERERERRSRNMTQRLND